MYDIRRETFSKSVWMPLRAVFHNEKKGRWAMKVTKRISSGRGLIAIPVDKIDAAKKLD